MGGFSIYLDFLGFFHIIEDMNKTRMTAIILLLLGVLVGYFVYASQKPDSSLYKPFKLGLDLSGGSHMVYQADVSQIKPTDVSQAMESLKGVIERRINVFGVTEPIIQVEQSSFGQGGGANKLVVDLPGVTDVKQAAELIKATPVLEFKIERPAGPEKEAITKVWTDAQTNLKAGQPIDQTNPLLKEDPNFISTQLTGRYLSRATVEFNSNSINPSVGLKFNSEGAKLFSDITKANVGKQVAIYLDGVQISAPVVREPITNGEAVISGNFNLDQAKALVRDLNLGALPVPIQLVSTETIGATLGEQALQKGIEAGVLAFIIVVLFILVLYRLPGFFAAISLTIYVAIMLALFKLVGVTMTAAGIAGFILSMGIAVDANILIFERMREELRRGKDIHLSLIDGFSRAWTSIRDSNLSTLITSAILFWFGSSLIKGFALTLAIGVIVSMFTAITLTRTFLLSLGMKSGSMMSKFLFGGRLTTTD